VREAVEHVLNELDAGRLRVATREGVGQWTTHQWIKKAVLLSFRLKDNEVIESGDLGFYDKVPTKFAGMSAEALKATGVRAVPPAVARRGSFQGKGVILMPSYCNIGSVRGRRHHGRHMGDCGLLRPDRQTRALVRWRGHRGCAGAYAGRPDHH